MLAVCVAAGCDGKEKNPTQFPTEPTPPVVTTASAYILPNAVQQNDWAFGDEPVVIHPNERLRWVNVDLETHQVVADTPDATDFQQTKELRPGAEQSFDMTRLGTTRIHCAIHPNMTGTLIVRER